MKLLFEATAPVDAPLSRVQSLVADGWVLDAFFGPDSAARQYVDIDHRDGVVGIQGHWWYRGEFSAAESGGQTMLTYRVYNIARRGAWAVPLANQMFIGYRRKVQTAATDLAQAIAQHLAEGA